jgi:aspartate-semialdehyde dehydrogenase
MKMLNIGVVGATGMVGEAFMRVLERHETPINELRPFASEASLGRSVTCQGRQWPVIGLSPGCFRGLDVVFFSSGDDISREWAPHAVREGAFAIDNSAAFRMNPGTPLVVPEVNEHLIPEANQPTLIANPNCSTIQLVVVLNALRNFKPISVKVATYQAVSGAGKAGRDELLAQSEKVLSATAAGRSQPDRTAMNPTTFAHPIAFNCVPQIGSFAEDGFCSEETKIIRETKKILEIPNLKVSAFTVRVPALNSHSEAAWVTFARPVQKHEILEALRSAQGLRLFENESQSSNYPTTLDASDAEPVFVGRVHQDADDPNTWLLWIVADNILKGAALNGLQIAERIFDIPKAP